MKIQNKDGFTFIEILISLAVVFAFVSLLTVFTGVTRLQKNKESNNICENIAQSSLDSIRSLSYEKHRAQLSNNGRIQSGGATLEEIDNNQVWNTNNPNALAGQQTQAHKAIVGSMRLLEGVYNSNAGFCNNITGRVYRGGSKEFLFAPTEISQEGRHIKNIETRIRIQAYNLLTGATNCSRPLYIRPMAENVQGRNLTPLAERLGVTVAPSNTQQNMGYLVSVFTSYDDPGGVRQSCSVSSRFRYPRLQSHALSAGMSVNLGVGGSLVACGSRKESARLEIVRHTNYAEQGLVYLCRDRSAARPGLVPAINCPNGRRGESFSVSNQWVNCDRVTVCGRSGRARYQGRSVLMQYRNIPWGCQARVEVRAVSPAGDTHAAPLSSGIVNYRVPDCNMCTTSCPNFAYCSPAVCTVCPPPPPPTTGGDGAGDGDGGDAGGGGAGGGGAGSADGDDGI